MLGIRPDCLGGASGPAGREVVRRGARWAQKRHVVLSGDPEVFLEKVVSRLTHEQHRSGKVCMGGCRPSRQHGQGKMGTDI